MDDEAKIHQQVVALTGTIGSGKSTVCSMLRQKGAYIVSADDLARKSVESGSPALKQIQQVFGDSVILPDGTLDRQSMADKVFSDPQKRKELENITHPIIHELEIAAFSEALEKNFPLLVYDCPLFFEAHLERRGYCCTVLVAAPEEKCIARVMRRNGLSEEQARQRLSAQMSIQQKRKLADYVLENNGTLEELQTQVDALFETLRKRQEKS